MSELSLFDEFDAELDDCPVAKPTKRRGAARRTVAPVRKPTGLAQLLAKNSSRRRAATTKKENSAPGGKGKSRKASAPAQLSSDSDGSSDEEVDWVNDQAAARSTVRRPMMGFSGIRKGAARFGGLTRGATGSTSKAAATPSLGRRPVAVFSSRNKVGAAAARRTSTSSTAGGVSRTRALVMSVANKAKKRHGVRTYSRRNTSKRVPMSAVKLVTRRTVRPTSRKQAASPAQPASPADVSTPTATPEVASPLVEASPAHAVHGTATVGAHSTPICNDQTVGEEEACSHDLAAAAAEAAESSAHTQVSDGSPPVGAGVSVAGSVDALHGVPTITPQSVDPARSASQLSAGGSVGSGSLSGMSLPSPCFRRDSGESRFSANSRAGTPTAAAAAAAASPASVFSSTSHGSSGTADSDGGVGVGLSAGWGQAEHTRLVRALQAYGVRRKKKTGALVASAGKWKRVQLEVGTKTLAQCKAYAELIMTGRAAATAQAAAPQAAAAPPPRPPVPADTLTAAPPAVPPSQPSCDDGDEAADTLAPLPTVVRGGSKPLLDWSAAQGIQERHRDEQRRRRRQALQRQRLRAKEQSSGDDGLRMLRRLSMMPLHGRRRQSSMLLAGPPMGRRMSRLTMGLGNLRLSIAPGTGASGAGVGAGAGAGVANTIPASPATQAPPTPQASSPAVSEASSVTGADMLASALPLVLEWVSGKELLNTTNAVSRQWARVSMSVYSWRAAGGTTTSANTANATDGGAPGEVEESASSDVDADAEDPDCVVPAEVLHGWEGFHTAYPWSMYLAEGAYKQVFKTLCRARGRLEAVSVTDVEGVAAGGNMAVIRQEIRCGCLLSELVRTGVCPNYVQIFQVFNYAYSPVQLGWGSSDDRCPHGDTCPPHLLVPATASSAGTATSSAPQPTARTARRSRRRGQRKQAAAAPRKPTASEEGVYQYLRAELCTGGDAEEFLRKLAASAASSPSPIDSALPVSSVQSLLLQMVWSLHVAQTRLHLRHYDVKLLNVLLQEPAVLCDPCTGDDSVPGVVSMRYHCEDGFALQLELATAPPTDVARDMVVKWADFGTADTRPSSLGRPIGLEHYTTLENTAPEMWLFGDLAKQSFAIDAFALGLSALHLVTGHVPYEELLETVDCPPDLGDALIEAWNGTYVPKASRRRGRKGRSKGKGKGRGATGGEDFNCTFDNLIQVLDGDEAVTTMQNTVYRILVLFGLPGQTTVGTKGMSMADMPSWWMPEAGTGEPRSRVCAAVADCLLGGATKAAKQFHADRAAFSLRHGNHDVLTSARARMEASDAGRGVLEVVEGFTALSPEHRLTVSAALRSAAFSNLVVSQDEPVPESTADRALLVFDPFAE